VKLLGLSLPAVPGKYAVEAVLSRGPVAVVALARGPGGGECVVKVAAIARARPLLENEAAVLQALGAAGVAGVPRILEAWDGGFALEKLEMRTLRDHGELVRSSRELRDAAARQAFARLADIHAARDAEGVPLGVVHGDVSPDNVYVAADGAAAAIADFGLARWRQERGGGDLETGAFRGTLLYAAPEVARGEPFDGRADDFALAASLLHVASGVALRGGAAGAGSSEAVILVEAGTRPLDASHPWRSFARASFREAVADALLACLAFDPRDRPRETPRPC
jgi:serine/threonine protein kinase